MNPATLESKQKNVRNILNYIIKYGEVSRPDLAKSLKLSTATVTNIISELLADHIVYEGRQDASKLGRRATLLRFNSALKYVLAVNIAQYKIDLHLCDLVGNVLSHAEETIDFRVSTTNNEIKILKKLIKILSTFIGNQPEETKSKLIAVALSLPGLVNDNNDVCIPFFNWNNLSLINPISAALGLHTYVVNVTRVKAIYEMRYINPDEKNILYISLSSGVGMVNFFDGKMIMGKTGYAGECGHMTLNINGPKCYCGNRGCFEYYCSEINILNQAKEWAHGKDPVLTNLVKNGAPLNMQTLFQAREEGSIYAHELLLQVSTYLAHAFVNLINCYDPDRIIVSGSLVELDDFVINSAIRKAKSLIFNTFSREPIFSYAHLKSDELEKAICAFLLDKVYDIILKTAKNSVS